MKKEILGLATIALSALNAGAWGQKGHDTTAYIAECHLTPTARAAAEKLLDGYSIVYYANWLDNASHTPEYAYSKTWHYKNVDAECTYENAPLNPSGDIVRSLQEQISLLNNPDTPMHQRQLALKMVVHLMGDIHQPMHLGHASDLGGNRWNVKYFKQDKNLHSVWDSSLPESAHKWSYTEWQKQIDRATPAQESEILTGSPLTWGKETYQICKDVYTRTPAGTNISFDYIAEWTPVIERQFLKGGLRLADILNTVFDPEYTPRTSTVKK